MDFFTVLKAAFENHQLQTINHIEDHSEGHLTKLVVHFTNGLHLSIIGIQSSYHGETSIFKIVVLGLEGKLVEGLFEENRDLLLKGCGKEKIISYIQKIGNLPSPGLPWKFLA